MPSSHDLVDTAIYAAQRTDRDQAFGTLLTVHPAPIAALSDVLHQIPGITERSDRVRSLGKALGSEVRAILLDVAVSDASLMVREAASQELAAIGAPATDAMATALEAALARGERAQPGRMYDAVTVLIGGLCRIGHVQRARLLQNARTHPDEHFRGAVIDALARIGDRDLLLSLLQISTTDPADPRTAAVARDMARRAAQAGLEHRIFNDGEILQIATHAPQPTLRSRALDEIAVPDSRAIQQGVVASAADHAVERQAGFRLLLRAGDVGRTHIRGRARAGLPLPSEAWWVLVANDPSWCLRALSGVADTGQALALLPRDGATASEVEILQHVALSAGPIRLRTRATHRIRASSPQGRAALTVLWLHALHARQRSSDAISPTTHRWATEIHPHLDVVLGVPDPIARVVTAWVRHHDTGHLRLAQALHAVLEPGDPNRFAGLIYDVVPEKSLEGLVGLCGAPIARMAESLALRAERTADPLLASWTALAAAVAAEQADAPERCRPMGARFPEVASLPHPGPPKAASGISHAAFRQLPMSARVQTVLTLSRRHPGKMSRSQARTVAQAISRKSANVRLLAMLEEQPRTGQLRRVLALSRRAHRRRGRPTPAPELHERSLEAVEDREARVYEDDWPVCEDGWPVYDDELPELFSEPELLLDGARHFRAVPVWAEHIVRQHYDSLRFPRPSPRFRFQDHLDPAQRDRIQTVVPGPRIPPWETLSGGYPPFSFDPDRDIEIMAPWLLHAVELCWHAARRGEDKARMQAFGERVLSALVLVFRNPPGDAADQDHILQILWRIGSAFPVPCARLVQSQVHLDPGWRVLLFAAWYVPVFRMHYGIWSMHPIRLQQLACRSRLCEYLSGQLPTLPFLTEPVRLAPDGLTVVEETMAPTDLRHVAVLMALGGGSLLRQDYPSFQVVARPSLSIVALSVPKQRALCALLLAIQHLRQRVVAGDLDGLMTLLFTHRYHPTPSPGQRGQCFFRPSDVPSWWGTAHQAARRTQLLKDAWCYGRLREEQPGRRRISRRLIRRAWTRMTPPAGTPTLQAMVDRFGPDRAIEGLVQGLLVMLHDITAAGGPTRPTDKEATIRALRVLCLTWGLEESWEEGMLWQPWELNGLNETQVRALVNTLVRVVHHVPTEVAGVLGLPVAQGLPRLLGGHRSRPEQLGQQLLVDLGSSPQHATGPDAEATTFVCRPLSKKAAIHRGDLGGDCSSEYVPFRCLSPHHTYYGIFKDGVQQRGYITVFEAWVDQDGGRKPMLCLETINVPIPIFDTIQLDLIHLLEAVAHSRGLGRALVLVTEEWSWNYLNGAALRRARPAREGAVTKLHPADPWSWSVYTATTNHDATTYNPFEQRCSSRRLAPTQVALDRIQPENAVEAERLAALPPRSLQPTAWQNGEISGFISSWPDPRLSDQ